MIRMVLAASLSLCGAAASAADPFDWKKTLELPLSPGTVAILVEHGSEAEVQDRWRAGLKSEDARVRAATARAIYGAGEKALAPALKDALDAEQDLRAAEEAIRALVVVGPADGDAAIVAAACRKPELRRIAWNHLGRARGTRALVHLAAARDCDDAREDRHSLVYAATNGGRTGLTEAAIVALRESDPAAWYVVWESLLSGGEIPEGMLLASVTSDNARVRAVTYWGAAVTSQHGKLPDAFQNALQTAPEAQADRKAFPVDESARLAHFAYGLVGRATGGKREDDVEWVQRQLTREEWPFPSPPASVVKLFSKNERKHLVKARYLPSHVERNLDFPQWSPKAFAAAAPSSTRAAVTDFPRGYVTGLMALTGCRDRELAGSVTYGAEGRPRSVTLLETEGLSEDCAKTGRILLASRPFRSFSTTLDVHGSSTTPSLQTVRLPPPNASAIAWDEGKSPDPVRVGGQIKDPVKIKHVQPNYPATARKARVQGAVVLETTIDISGRVEDVKVLRGMPLLDAAAIEAVRQWVFKPTLVEGVPVPVIYTVTVTFDIL